MYLLNVRVCRRASVAPGHHVVVCVCGRQSRLDLNFRPAVNVPKI